MWGSFAKVGLPNHLLRSTWMMMHGNLGTMMKLVLTSKMLTNSVNGCLLSPQVIKPKSCLVKHLFGSTCRREQSMTCTSITKAPKSCWAATCLRSFILNTVWLIAFSFFLDGLIWPTDVTMFSSPKKAIHAIKSPQVSSKYIQLSFSWRSFCLSKVQHLQFCLQGEVARYPEISGEESFYPVWGLSNPQSWLGW